MAGRNEFDFRAEIENTEPTKRKMKELGKASKDVGDQAAKGQEKVKKATSGTKKSIAGFVMRIKGMVNPVVLAFAAITAGVAAFRAEMRAAEQQAELITSKFAGLRETLSLGDDPNLIHTINRIQIEAGMPGVAGFNEINAAINSLRSKSAEFTPEQQEAIFTEAVQMKQLTSASLTTLVDTMLFQKKSAMDKSAPQLQNILKQTQIDAGATLSGIARFFPQIIEIGQLAGLKQEEVAGLFATGTAALPDVSAVTTGLRNLFTILKSEGTPEQEALKEQFGLDPSQGVLKQIATMGRAKPDVAELTTLFGRESLVVAQSLIKAQQTGALGGTISRIMQAGQTERDLTLEDIQRINAPDTVTGKEFRLRRLQAEEEVTRMERFGVKSLDIEIAKQEARNRGLGGATASEFEIGVRESVRGMFETMESFGVKTGKESLTIDSSVNFNYIVNPELGRVRDPVSP